MMDSSPSPLTEELLEQLLGLDTYAEELSWLEANGFLDAAGLSSLLEHAMRLARSDPGQATRLTRLCERAAGLAQAPEILPHAIYNRAQTHALNGEFHTALELIDAAESEYARQGDRLSALRTNLGRIHVFNESGRHLEALAAAQTVLDTIAQEGLTDPQARLMTALAWSNKGICLETTGQYEQALQAYDQAEAEFAALGQNERIGDVSSNRGIVQVHLGRAREALASFEQAANIQEQAGLTLLLAQTTSNIGDAYLSLGNYTQALQAYQRAGDWLKQMDARASHGILLRKTADAYLALNLYPEAVSIYQEASEMLQNAGMADHHARALGGLGAARLAQGRLEEAGPALQQAEQIFAAAKNTPMQAAVLLERSALLQAQGEREQSFALAHEAYRLVAGEAGPVQRMYAGLRLADLSMEHRSQDAADQAAAYLAEIQPLAEAFELPVIRYRLESRLGRLKLLHSDRVEARDLDEAQAHLEKAAALIEGLRGSLAHETVRAAFFHDKVALFNDLVRVHLLRAEREDNPANSWRKAFEAAEAAKSRTLLDMASGLRGGRRTGQPEADEEAARLQADLSAVYNRWLAVSGVTGSAQAEALRSRAQAIEEKLSRLRLQVPAEPARDPFQAGVSLERVYASLPGDTFLLSYYVLGDEILVFILSGVGTLQVVRNVAALEPVQTLLQRLAVQWDRFLLRSSFLVRHAAILEQSAKRVLAGLYESLIAPLRPSLPDRARLSRLVIIPHALLHQAPFHALYDGQRYLLEDYEISYALSAALYGLGLDRPVVRIERALVIGLGDDLIPAAEVEAQGVARLLEQAGVDGSAWLGERAQRSKFLAEFAPDRQTPAHHNPAVHLIHLACHGIFRPDNPIFSSLQFADGWLNAADILDLHLDGAVAALSACESARSQVLGGGEVIGLPRAFLGAGAAGVLVSLWLVQDEAARDIMQAWYAAWLPHGDRVTALRQAQLLVKEKYPHPFYWAPFIYLGR